MAVLGAGGFVAPGIAHGQGGASSGRPVVDSIFDGSGGSDDWLSHTQYTQPGAPRTQQSTSPPQPAPATQQRRPFTRSSYSRLARVPNMFGDSIGPSPVLVITPLSTPAASVDLPLAAGARRTKFAENDKAMPMDRVFFMYNHFENAFSADSSTFTPGVRNYDLDRYTVGVEKTFFDERASVAARIPLANRFVFSQSPIDVAGGEVGNLAITFKGLLYQDDDEVFALTGGLGIDTPTGCDVDVRYQTTEIFIENHSAHLLPFLTMLVHPDDDWFVQGSLQFDFATNGNPVTVDDPFSGKSTRSGVLTDQSLMYVDLSIGRWLYRNEESDYFRGLAGIVELHYTSSLQDADGVAFATRNNIYTLGNVGNRFDFLNLTTGVQVQFDELTNVRVGGVFPLRSGFDRPFDAEVQVSVNRHF